MSSALPNGAGVWAMCAQVKAAVDGGEANLLHSCGNDCGGFFGDVLNGYADILGFVSNVTNDVISGVTDVAATCFHDSRMGLLFGHNSKEKNNQGGML